jgi:hypothetical protein
VDLLLDVGSLPDDDAGEAVDFARRLRSELLTLDVSSVELKDRGEMPSTAKGAAALVAALCVKLGEASLKTLLDKVSDWILRTGRTVEVTIDGDTIKLTKPSKEEQQRLVDAWLARHG